jgi:hypothetical protein
LGWFGFEVEKEIAFGSRVVESRFHGFKGFEMTNMCLFFLKEIEDAV